MTEPSRTHMAAANAETSITFGPGSGSHSGPSAGRIGEEPFAAPSVLRIDLGAVASNLSVVRSVVGPDVAICPVVKADAYGLGAPRIARTLAAAGADMLAVYTPEQATELMREALPTALLVLMPVRTIGRTDPLYRALVCGRLHLTVHDAEHAAQLGLLAERFGTTVRVHVEIDTGMTRGGSDAADAPELLRVIAAHPRLELTGIYTHFASADVDEPSAAVQDEVLESILQEHAELVPPTCVVHAASTCATIRAKRYHRAMVRVGVAWAGYGCELVDGDVIEAARALRPCLRWTSSLVHVRHIRRGATVGYRGRWRARRRSIVGLVPVGYADGYPFALGDGGGGRARGIVRVRVAGDAVEAGTGEWHDAPVIGAVNMDQLTIDLTDVPGARVGDDVELIGADASSATHLPKLAAAARTIPYEIMCRLSPRLPRLFVTERMPEIIIGANGARLDQPAATDSIAS